MSRAAKKGSVALAQCVPVGVCYTHRTLPERQQGKASFDYSDDGLVHGVQFVIKVNDRFLPVRLPARVEKAQTVLKRQWEAGIISQKRGFLVRPAQRGTSMS